MPALIKSLAIERLKERLALLEPSRRKCAPQDGAAPWRDLTPGALHEIAGCDWRDGIAASGYALALASRLARTRQGAVVFLALKGDARDRGLLYAPGGAVYGIEAARVALCAAENLETLLWAAEEAARSPSVAALVIETSKPRRHLNLTATRRLQLAAEASGATPILIRAADDGEPTSALRRFRAAAAPSAPKAYDACASGNSRWRVELERCRLGNRGAWVVEWDEENRELKEAQTVFVPLPAALADRPARARDAVA